MIIVCNEKEATKKSIKKFPKIVISSDIKSLPEGDDSFQYMNQFLPNIKLFHKYLNNEIGNKKYMKKYMKNIRENDELMASLTLLMMIYKENKDMVFICSTNEMNYNYIQFLCKVIEEDFGEDCIEYYKQWQDKKSKTSLDEKKLKKMVNKYKHIIFEDNYEVEEKPKKKKKDKYKKTSANDLIDEVVKLDKKKKKKNENKEEYLNNYVKEVDVKSELDNLKSRCKLKIMKRK